MIFAILMLNNCQQQIALTMIKNLLILFLVALIASTTVSAKKPRKKDIVPIENLMMVDNYDQALKQLVSLQKQHPNAPYLHLLKGICLLNMNNNTKEAIPPLEIAKKEFGIYSSKNDNALKANFHLGQAYHLTYEFEKALTLFKQLSDTVPTKRTDIHQRLNEHINYCQNAIKLKQSPVDFRITNLGQAINTEFDEHSPVVSGDENILMFTSNKQGLSRSNKDKVLFPEDIYITHWRDGQWLPSKNIGGEVNTNSYDATCSLSSDGKSLILYRSNAKGDLFISQLEDDKWTKPQKLPKPINTSFEESHASLSLDGNTIIFTSDRPGGFGGKDIYMAHKLPDGTWGKVSLLGPEINTELNEESPFLSHDGQTLFFASEGHESMGGYDIFKSEKNDAGEWQTAVNIGYPINTPGDDLFYIPTLDGQRVYFASERAGGYGRADIYIIEFPTHDERSLAVVSGYLFTETGFPSANSTITITDEKTGNHIGDYKPQNNTGKYTMILPTGVKYLMTIVTPGMTSLSKQFEIPYRSNYKTRATATYIDPMVIKK